MLNLGHGIFQKVMEEVMESHGKSKVYEPCNACRLNFTPIIRVNIIYRPSGNSGGRCLKSSSSLSRFIRCIAPVVSLANLDRKETSKACWAAVRPAKKIIVTVHVICSLVR